jgi:hypothetical protein
MPGHFQQLDAAVAEDVVVSIEFLEQDRQVEIRPIVIAPEPLLRPHRRTQLIELAKKDCVGKEAIASRMIIVKMRIGNVTNIFWCESDCGKPGRSKLAFDYSRFPGSMPSHPVDIEDVVRVKTGVEHHATGGMLDEKELNWDGDRQTDVMLHRKD